MDDLDKPNLHAAREIARNILKKSRIKTHPILIREIAKHIPDLYIDGQELEDGLSGMQISYKGIDFIRYNKNHSDKRNRFTVAHEIGHAVLGHTVECTRGVSGFENNYEQEANCFAAELLTPLTYLKLAVKKNKSVSTLAKAFWVSKDSMGIRVRETNLYLSLTSWD